MNINENVRIKKKSQKIKGYTYKTTHISAANLSQKQVRVTNTPLHPTFI